MKLRKHLLYATGVLIAVAVIATFAAPTVSAAIKAVFVEVTIPSRPYYGSMSASNSAVSLGPDIGTLGVSNLTLTNFDSTRQQVFIFAPIFASGGCGGSGSNIIGGGGPQMNVYVQPGETLSFAYPAPLVFRQVGGHTCVAAEVTTILHGGSVEVDVTGFVN
jgi:hypothetical protein